MNPLSKGNAPTNNSLDGERAGLRVAQDRLAVRVAIALGGNLGDTRQILSDAVKALDEVAGLDVSATSRLYKTAPVGPPQPDYLNACVLADTTLAPSALLVQLLAIEQQFGRVRKERWGARSLDLDLLFFGDQVIDAPLLTVPHPRLHERAFVLFPLADVSPDWSHPILGKTTMQLLTQLSANGPTHGVEQISAL
ncbi:MAG: 2-amino-4-hydroxy-6-hydroxymethyldihydropteridine diphosphokinase [Phormidesmis sp.]